MAVLVQQRPRIQVQRAAFFDRRQTPNCLSVQPVQSVAGFLTKHVEEPAQGGLTGDGLHAQHLAQGRIALQPSHARELVGAAENAADITQRHVGRIVSVGTGRTMGQDFSQLVAETFLMQKMRPHDHPSMCRQPLVGE
jgi:hypothetical protein